MGAQNGYFCDVLINGHIIPCLCDSGANVSIINSKIVEKWGKDEKLEILPVNIMLCTVTGENKPFIGKAVMKLDIGGHIFNHEMLISDMVQDCILGIDFMRQNKCDLLISKNQLVINGDKIPCYMKTGSEPACCRVTVCENVTVDPNSEVVVSGKIIDHVDRDSMCLVEGGESFLEKTGLMVAKV